MHQTLENAQKLAALARVDIRTAMRFLLGAKTKRLAQARLETAARALESLASTPNPAAISAKDPQQA